MEWHGAPHKWPNIYGEPYLYRHHTSIYPKLVEAQLVHNKSLEPTSWWIPTDGKPNLCLGCCLDLTSPGKLGYLVYGKSLIQFSASTCFNPKSRSWDATSWNPHGPQDGTANTPETFFKRRIADILEGSHPQVSTCKSCFNPLKKYQSNWKS